MKRIIFVLCMLLCGLFLESCNKNSELALVDVMELRRGNVKRIVEFTGTIESDMKNQVVTTNYTSKKIKKVYVDVGSVVNAGDVVAEFEDDKLIDTNIVARQAGVVSAIYVEPGFECSDGRVVEIQDDKLLKCILYIEDGYINEFEIGQKVVINTVFDENNQSFGKVEKISRLKDKEMDGFRVVVSLERPQIFRLGEEIEAKVTVNTWKDVFVVNYGSVMRDGEEWYVLIASESEEEIYTLKKMNVSEIYDGDDYIGIESGLLNEGDYIVKEVYNYEPGLKVNVEVEE